MDYFSLDLETSGLKTSSQGGLITQVAICKYSEDSSHTIVYDEIIHSQNGIIPHKIEVLTGITTEKIRQSKKSLQSALVEITDLIRGYPVVIHNAMFDTSQLNDCLMMRDLSVIQDYCDVYCSLKYCREWGIFQDNKLETIASYFDIQSEGYHNAAFDTLVLSKIVEKIGIDRFFCADNLYFKEFVE
jgi:DNA polymerase III epsilon subunit-like protein